MQVLMWNAQVKCKHPDLISCSKKKVAGEHFLAKLHQKKRYHMFKKSRQREVQLLYWLVFCISRPAGEKPQDFEGWFLFGHILLHFFLPDRAGVCFATTASKDRARVQSKPKDKSFPGLHLEKNFLSTKGHPSADRSASDFMDAAAEVGN